MISGQCEQCGSVFTGQKGKRFCTDTCQRRNNSAKPVAKTCGCEGCGVSFNPKRTDRTRFCSRTCAFASAAPQRRAGATRAAAATVIREALRPLLLEVAELTQMRRGMLASLDRQAVLSARRSRCSRPCLHCGVTIGSKAAGPGPTRYCSAACAKRSPAAVEAKRTARRARKARQRGVQVEPVNPTRVFERDGWKCHLCGGKTYRAKRGSYHSKAPELDHIVPLSKGGAHSYANTACAHRSCNAAKSDQIIGQPSLFAA